jgi:hypothetical protein
VTPSDRTVHQLIDESPIVTATENEHIHISLNDGIDRDDDYENDKNCHCGQLPKAIIELAQLHLGHVAIAVHINFLSEELMDVKVFPSLHHVVEVGESELKQLHKCWQ